MAYQDIVEMHDSSTLRARITACVALEGISDPDNWAYQNAWKTAAQPGWADAWAYARDNGMIDEAERGRNGGVISDSMILSAVQFLSPPQESV